MKRKQAYLGKLRPQMLKISILPVALLCLSISFTVYAQLPGADFATPAQYPPGLEIGDEIPEEVWDLPLKVANHPEGRESITLNDYKGKLIVLDFWATWCGVCISAMPKMDKLQKRFNNKIAIIPVAHQSGKLIGSFWENNQKLNELNLPTVVDDIFLESMFPHRMKPHVVWIIDNKVIAITGTTDVNVENIQKVLNKKYLHLPEKRDVLDFDHNEPLSINDDKVEEQNFLFRSLVTHYLPGVTSQRGIKIDKESNTIRAYATNTSIIKLFRLAFPDLHLYPIHRILIETEFPFKYSRRHKTKKNRTWAAENLYCYDLIIPLRDSSRLKDIVRQDLERYFNVQGKFERRDVTYMQLICTNLTQTTTSTKHSPQLAAAQHTKIFHQAHVWELVGWMNTLPDFPKIINKTGYKELININLDLGTISVTSIKKELLKYGFDLREVTENLKVFVLTEKKLP